MSEVESNFDALYRRPDFLNENNSLRNLLDTATQTIESSVTTTNQDRNNNNLLAKKRRLRKFKRIKALQNKQTDNSRSFLRQTLGNTKRK